MKKKIKVITFSIGITIGFCVSMMVNILSLWIQTSSSIMKILIFIMLALIVILLGYIAHILNDRLSLIERFERHKGYITGYTPYNTPKTCYSGIPNYILKIGNYFTKEEIKKLDKFKMFAQTDRTILTHLELLNF